MSSEDDEVVEIDVEVNNSTDLALLVHDGKTEAWVPRSQIVDEVVKNGRVQKIVIPVWLAEDRGLV